jgi:hypothetical protein
MQNRGGRRTAVTTQRRTTPQALVVVLAVFLLCSGLNGDCTRGPNSPAESPEQNTAAKIMARDQVQPAASPRTSGLIVAVIAALALIVVMEVLKHEHSQ